MASPSGSFPTNLISLATCSTALIVWSFPLGASFTAVIFNEIIAVLLSNSPSLTLNVNESLVALLELLI